MLTACLHQHQHKASNTQKLDLSAVSCVQFAAAESTLPQFWALCRHGEHAYRARISEEEKKIYLAPY